MFVYKITILSMYLSWPVPKYKEIYKKMRKKKFKILGLISQLFSRAIFYFSKQKKPENTYAN